MNAKQIEAANKRGQNDAAVVKAAVVNGALTVRDIAAATARSKPVTGTVHGVKVVGSWLLGFAGTMVGAGKVKED